MPPFLFSVRFMCVILIFMGYCFNFMQKIDMSIAIVCMTNHTAIKMLQQSNTTNYASNYTYYNTTTKSDESCPLMASAKHKYV